MRDEFSDELRRDLSADFGYHGTEIEDTYSDWLYDVTNSDNFTNAGDTGDILFMPIMPVSELVTELAYYARKGDGGGWKIPAFAANPEKMSDDKFRELIHELSKVTYENGGVTFSFLSDTVEGPMSNKDFRNRAFDLCDFLVTLWPEKE